MSTAPSTRHYRVSALGHTSGLVVIAWKGRHVTVMVLPKVWPAPSAALVDLQYLPHAPVCVRELGTLVVQGDNEQVLQFGTILEGCADLAEGEDPAVDGGASKLFTRLAGNAPTVTPFDMPEGMLSSFWTLALRFQEHGVLWDESLRALKGQNAVTSYLTSTGLCTLPDLHNALCRLFVAQSSVVLRGRPPLFTSEIRRTTRPQGRMIIRDLVKRSRRTSPAVACETGILSRDDPWTRLILCGLREVAGDIGLDTTTRRSALALGRGLRDVKRLDAQDAWNDVRGRPVPRKFRQVALVSRLAETIVRRDPAFGDLESQGRQGVTATLVVRTSRIYECVLKEAAERLGHRVENGADYRIWVEPGNAKAPDLVLVGPLGIPTAVVDAKYKSLSHMGAMPMSDQYQQFAYASIVDAPSLFCYAAHPGSAPQPAETRTANTAAQHLLGCGWVGFPKASEVDDSSWVERAALEMAEGLALVTTPTPFGGSDESGDEAQPPAAESHLD
jgi:hypothetical protein